MQNRLNLLKKQKSNFNDKDDNIVESNSSSIRLLLRSNDDAPNRKVQEPSVHRPFGSVMREEGECLPESRNVARAEDRRSPPVLPRPAAGSKQFPKLDDKLLHDAKRDVQNILPLQPSLSCARANGNLSDGGVDKSCLFDAAIGLSADGFVDKY